jgi:hypothetical protein
VSSSLPNALPAFVSIVTAALPADFQVKEGQIFNPYVAPQSLLITGVHFTLDSTAELGPLYKHEEHYSILCALTTTGGTDDQASRLAEAYGLYANVSIAVANNPNLNNTVRLAWTRQLDYVMGYDAKGFSVGTVQFEVQCQARVTSLT